MATGPLHHTAALFGALLPVQDPIAAGEALVTGGALAHVAIVLNLLSDDWRTSATVIGMVVGAVLLDRGPSWHDFTSLAVRFIPGIAIAIPLVTLRALMGPRPYAAVLRVGPLAAAISTPGLEAGVLLAWKVVAGLALAVLLMTTTPVPRLLAALHWFRVPGIVVEVASLAYRYRLLLAEEGGRLRDAQRLRRCRMRVGHRVADSSSLVDNLFIRAYDRGCGLLPAAGISGSPRQWSPNATAA